MQPTNPEKDLRQEVPVIVADAVTDALEEHEAPPDGLTSLDPEFRYELIKRTAYSFAEQRGFAPGHELDDWLAAETAIDQRLAAGARRP